MSTSKANVICMKWGQKYGSEYVNKLYEMTARNLSIPFRFVCMTDDSEGIRKEVDILPLPPMELPSGKERGWRKLSVFQKNLFDLQGTSLFLDLDVVIVDSINPFFEEGGDFLICREWQHKGMGNSSVFRFEIGAHPEVFEYFTANIDKVKAEHRHEQSYLSKFMQDKGVMKFWPEKWCVSFKRHCMKNIPFSLWQTPEIPDGAKIIIFHGDPNPDGALAGKIEGPRRFVRFLRPTKWIADFWKE